MPITINGTTGIAGVDGSAGTPAVQGTDTNTGEFFPAADTLAWSTGGSERMRVTSAGNVGIGTTSPSSGASWTYVTVAGKSTSQGGVVEVFNSDATLKGQYYAFNSTINLGASTNHPLIFLTNNSERARFNAGAPILCLSGGNTSATGTGIAFPATQSASSDANTLDDYEEGNWTPTFLGAGTAGTYTLSGTEARYTKVGRMVTLYGKFGFSAASGGSAYARVDGLPFPVDTTNFGTAMFSTVDLDAACVQVCVARVSPGTNSSLFFSQLRDNLVDLEVPVASFTTSSTVYFTFTYFVS